MGPDAAVEAAACLGDISKGARSIVEAMSVALLRVWILLWRRLFIGETSAEVHAALLIHQLHSGVLDSRASWMRRLRSVVLAMASIYCWPAIFVQMAL